MLVLIDRCRVDKICMAENLENLLAYCRANGRICPEPRMWARLWRLLPNRKRKGLGWEPPLPPILAAWYDVSDASKADMLQTHIEWASNNGDFGRIEVFLRKLSDKEWHHIGD